MLSQVLHPASERVSGGGGIITVTVSESGTTQLSGCPRGEREGDSAKVTREQVGPGRLSASYCSTRLLLGPTELRQKL